MTNKLLECSTRCRTEISSQTGKSDAIKANAINGVAGHNLAQDAQLIVVDVGQEGSNEGCGIFCHLSSWRNTCLRLALWDHVVIALPVRPIAVYSADIEMRVTFGKEVHGGEDLKLPLMAFIHHGGQQVVVRRIHEAFPLCEAGCDLALVKYMTGDWLHIHDHAIHTGLHALIQNACNAVARTQALEIGCGIEPEVKFFSCRLAWLWLLGGEVFTGDKRK